MNEKTKTYLGQQIIDRWGKHPAVNCRDMTNSIWNGKLKKNLEDAIAQGRKDAAKWGVNKVYILLNLRNEGLLGPNVKHFTYLINREEFPPKESAMMWAYDYTQEQLYYGWIIPDKDSVNEILDIPETYDPHLVECCHKFRHAKRIAIRAEK
jgi:hypothetical protein